MLISGYWLLCDDGIVRPVIRGEVLAADGSWRRAEFLTDTAADCTVFTAQVWAALGLQPAGSATRLTGAGGGVPSVVIATAIQMLREDGTPVVFRGRFAACTDPHGLDMSLLGRDISNLFALIVDRPGDVVCLLGQRHRYLITAG